MTPLRLFIAGEPAPKGSKRAFMRPGMTRPIVIEQSHDRIKSWESSLRDAAVIAMRDREAFVDVPLELRIVFGKRRPKNHYRANGQLKPTAPLAPMAKNIGDCSKLVRCMEDAWNGLVWDDDSRIARIVATKTWVDIGKATGAFVEVDRVLTLDGDESAYAAAVREFANRGAAEQLLFDRVA
jgi:Holliday junction resolvase RusA-like endonuclease